MLSGSSTREPELLQPGMVSSRPRQDLVLDDLLNRKRFKEVDLAH